MNPYINLNRLQLTYQQLDEMQFLATYQGAVNDVPQMVNPRDVLSIRLSQEDLIFNTLSSICDTLQTYNGGVWKGITRPVHSPGITEYLLWVEPDPERNIPQQSVRNFKIDKCTVLPGDGTPFSAVVNIKVSVVYMQVA